MAGRLRAPAARKASAQRDSHWGGPLDPHRGKGRPQGISRGRWGEGGARAGAGGRVGVGFFF